MSATRTTEFALVQSAASYILIAGVVLGVLPMAAATHTATQPSHMAGKKFMHCWRAMKQHRGNVRQRFRAGALAAYISTNSAALLPVFEKCRSSGTHHRSSHLLACARRCTCSACRCTAARLALTSFSIRPCTRRTGIHTCAQPATNHSTASQSTASRLWRRVKSKIKHYARQEGCGHAWPCSTSMGGTCGRTNRQ